MGLQNKPFPLGSGLWICDQHAYLSLVVEEEEEEEDDEEKRRV
jgi:hypothetical protein